MNVLKTLIKKIAPNFVLRFRAYKLLIKNEKSFLYKNGWMESLKLGKPVSEKGSIRPWMNVAVIDFLSSRLNKGMSIFEYGSGYSTLYFAERVGSITSLEYDEHWFSILSNNTLSNADLWFCNNDIDGVYCRKIKELDESLDIIVIDGRDRVNCIKQSIDKLSNEGVIILDDSDRPRYQKGKDFLLERGFRALSFNGLKLIDTDLFETTIFYKDNNCLGL